jgi:hypothetical protein
MKNTKTSSSAKKKTTQTKLAKPAAKKVTKKVAKKSTKTPVKKIKAVSKKPSKTKAQVKPKAEAKTTAKAEKKEKIRKNPNGMNYFQQCVVLAALINQKRHQDHEFQTIPLPEITSSLLAPLREYLSQYAFTSDEIQNGLEDLVHCDLFTKTFPVKNSTVAIDLTVHGNPKKIMSQLIELAGPEARKVIFLKEESNRFMIHRTTLEKYALKTGQVEGHATHHDSSNYMSHESTHREILNQINQRTNPKYFGQDHPQNFSTKQRRGRG